MKSISAATLLLLASTSLSWALDPEAAVKRIQVFSKAQGQSFTYESIENANDDSFELKGVSYSVADEKPLTFATVSYQSVMEGDGGQMTIGKVVYNNMAFANKDVSITMEHASASDLVIPAAGETDAMKSLGYYSQMSAKNIVIKAKDAPVATMASVTVDVDPFVEGKPLGMQGSFNGISADLTDIKDPQTKAILGQLGYDGKFAGTTTFNGSWNPSNGRIVINNFDIKVDNVGTLSMAFAITGYTAELAKRIQQANQGTDNQASGMAIMAELPKLKLENLSFRFTDDSVTKRVLTFQGKQMGGTADDIAKMVPTMLPLVMGQLGNPKFTTMVAGAVGRFLGEPKNITISAKPDMPIPFSELMGIGMAAPQTLPDALAVKVTANE